MVDCLGRVCHKKPKTIRSFFCGFSRNTHVTVNSEVGMSKFDKHISKSSSELIKCSKTEWCGLDMKRRRGKLDKVNIGYVSR